MGKIFSTIFIVLVIFVLGGIYFWFGGQWPWNRTLSLPSAQQLLETPDPSASPVDSLRLAVVSKNLNVPWDIRFLPNNEMLVTERRGTVRLIRTNGTLEAEPVLTIEDVRQVGEGGLHGIAIHPKFNQNNYVYFYYTYAGSGDTLNRVVRYKYRDNIFKDRQVIVDAIPGNSNHDGGRIAFGPDNYLYITTGDAQVPSLSQDRNSLAGKILRVRDDGTAAAGNPFNNRTYSYGHRNPQGITWDDTGTLWSTEHGPSGAQSGNDELNKIISGSNYGWPDFVGTRSGEGIKTPISTSGDTSTWAPAGLAYLDGYFYFAGLRGQALYRVSVNNDQANIQEFMKGELGRIRAVTVGPDKMLYISTSNRDGRGAPSPDDDQIIRVNPSKL